MSGKVNILVVDDLADKRLAFREVLEELDENLVLVSSGADALRELLERDFAVIVLDVNMPDIDGIETAELIRKHGRTAHTPIIFVTAYADELQTERGYELGAVDYILTPVVPAILRSKVRVFVDLYRAQQRAADAARAEAARAAAVAAQRSSDLISLASRELATSLDLQASMMRLLEVLVPTVGGCAVLSVAAIDTAGAEIALIRRSGEPVCALGASSQLPPTIRRAMDEVQSGGYVLEIRVDAAGPGHWPAGLRVAHVLPLKIGDRSIGALVIGRSARDEPTLDDRGLLEIAARAAIAFDNARLYSSLNREMDRAKSAEQKLQEANRRKDEFLAMLSHELRNPLAPIMTAAQVLRNVAPTDSRVGWVRDVIERQVTHLTGLVDDLLDVSRITQGKITLHREAIELGKAIDHAAEIVRALVDSKRHTLSIRMPPAPVWVFGDFARLSQIFSNVLNNAAKYTPDGGNIEVEVVADRGSAVVRVRDNGIGIDAQFLPEVFDVFTQGQRGLDRNEGGLGVGLAVVRRLVELHQGKVAVTSGGAGLGTEVTIELPCISEVKPQPELPLLSARKPEGKRILVVDDNADAAESIAMLLGIDGHEVKTSGDATQALSCMETFMPEVAIIDIGLPGKNGYELAETIRASRIRPQPLLLALTGYGQAEDFDRSREAGFDHHFVKPADPMAIRAAISGGRAADREPDTRRLV